MRYDSSKLPIADLVGPIADATAAMTRLDERVARSSNGAGVIERMHYLDACASLWVDGELVHIEDLVLHDAITDVRTPTHELTIASDVLRTRRRIVSKPAGWPMSVDGIRDLSGKGLESLQGEGPTGGTVHEAAMKPEPQAGAGEGEGANEDDPLAAELAAMDAVLARSEVALFGATTREVDTRDPLIYELDWDEGGRVADWLAVLEQVQDLPPVLRAALLLDAWHTIEVLQHARWLGRLIAAASLRQMGLTTGVHLAAFNLGLKNISVDQRRNWKRDRRLAAYINGIRLAAEAGLRDHDKLSLARQTMERRLIGRRSSSRLPDLIELVLSRPMVSTRTISKALGISQRNSLRLIEELNVRELTGRGRFRAWGVI